MYNEWYALCYCWHGICSGWLACKRTHTRGTDLCVQARGQVRQDVRVPASHREIDLRMVL